MRWGIKAGPLLLQQHPHKGAFMLVLHIPTNSWNPTSGSPFLQVYPHCTTSSCLSTHITHGHKSIKVTQKPFPELPK